MTTIKKVLLNSLLLIITLLTLFILAEGVTRLIMPNMVKLRLMHKPDEKLGYRMVPNYEMTHQTSDFTASVKINSEGLRDHEYPPEKDPKVFRVLTLGDSFTFGVGVNLDESYPKVLEALLNRRPIHGGVRKYEVINAGVEGYGTTQEYIYLGELLRRFSPELVIVGLHSNDVTDVMEGIPSATSKNKLKNRFYFLSYLRGLQLISYKAFGIGVNKRLFEIYRYPYSPKLERALQMTKDYLVNIRDHSKSSGAKTLIVIIPSSIELDKSEWEKKGFGRLYTDDFFAGNMGRFSETFTEFGRVSDIPTLPLLPILRSSKVRPLYFAQDAHWTKEGHRLAAEAIYDYLKEGSLN